MGIDRRASFPTTMAFLAIMGTACDKQAVNSDINIQDYYPSREENLKMTPNPLTAHVIWFGDNEQIVIPPPLIIERMDQTESRALFEELARFHSGICNTLPQLEIKEATGQFDWPTFGPIFTYFSQYHQGLDISPPFGTPVAASDGGIVIGKFDEDYGYGKYILLYHGLGKLTLYAHLSRMEVELGQRVQKSQLIGRVGSTGRSTGPHLHFETLVECQPKDPLSLLPK